MFGRVSVTIEAAIETGVVGADIDALDTAADVPLVFVFPCGDGATYDSFDESLVNTHSGWDTHGGKVYFPGTCVQLDRGRGDGLPERICYFPDLF